MILNLICNLIMVFWFMPFWLITLSLTIHKIEDKRKTEDQRLFKNNKIFIKSILVCMIPIVNIYFVCIVIKTAFKSFWELVKKKEC